MTVINETNPPDFLQSGFWILLVLMILSVILIILNLRKIPRADLLLMLGITLMTLTSARSVHLYGILAPFCLAGLFVDLKQVPWIAKYEKMFLQMETQLRVYLAAVLVTLISLFVLITGQRIDLYKFDEHLFPVQAVAWLRNHPQSGNLFNDFNWGGYLILMSEPKQLVFIDSMADHTGVLTKEYAQAIAPGGNWQEIFDRYQIQWAILPAETILNNILQKTPPWRVIYSDGDAVILRHDIE